MSFTLMGFGALLLLGSAIEFELTAVQIAHVMWFPHVPMCEL